MIENPKNKIILALFGVLALFAAGFGVMMFLDQAKLFIEAEPPYSVTVLNEGLYPCSSSPCRIDLIKGDYDILLKKEGYRDIQYKVTLGRRSNVVEKFEFELIPYIETLSADEGESVFIQEEETAYLEQKPGRKQALYIKSGDEDVVAAYFNIPIEDYDIKSMNDGKIIAVVEHGEKDLIYLVDTEKKSRTKIAKSDFEIKNISCSYNGKWCIYESESTFIVNTETGEAKSDENLNIPVAQTAWSGDGKLFLVAKYKSEGESDEDLYYVQRFDPETWKSENILATSDFKSAPEAVKYEKKAIYVKNKDGYFAAKF